jgi:hypothetical protein
MAEVLPQNVLPHDKFWPQLRQKSCYKNSDQTKILARTLLAICANAAAQCYGLIARGCPLYTGDVYYHHIIFIMEIDADVMEKLLNNQPHFCRPWSVRVRLVGEEAGLNGI